SPKSTQKRKIGIQASMVGVVSKLKKSARYPFWKTRTIAPYAAPTESRFIRIALIGTTIERKTTSRSRKLRLSTNANTIGVQRSTSEKKSALKAVSPET